MDAPLSQIGDYLLARAETERDLVREVLRTARKDNDHFREKLAAKLVALHDEEEEMIKHYVETKLSYPELALELERYKPYLKELWSGAERDWARIKARNEGA